MANYMNSNGHNRQQTSSKYNITQETRFIIIDVETNAIGT